MTIGICCQWLEKVTNSVGTVSYVNSIGEKALQLNKFESKTYSNSHILKVYIHNVEQHIKLVPKLNSAKIKHFRISSNLLPLIDKVPQEIKESHLLAEALTRLGSLFKESGIRVTTHPGQFTVLSSDSPYVIRNSVQHLLDQAWVFDCMGLERSVYNAINIHGGKANRLSTLISSINNLPDSIRTRLTLENDERCYSTKQLSDISKETNVPIVFDSHHHTFNEDGLDLHDAFHIANSTWKDIIPVQHLSNSEPENESASYTLRRLHSWQLHHIPEIQRIAVNESKIALEMEFKGKNLGVLPHLERLGLNL